MGSAAQRLGALSGEHGTASTVLRNHRVCALGHYRGDDATAGLQCHSAKLADLATLAGSGCRVRYQVRAISDVHCPVGPRRGVKPVRCVGVPARRPRFDANRIGEIKSRTVGSRRESLAPDRASGNRIDAARRMTIEPRPDNWVAILIVADNGCGIMTLRAGTIRARSEQEQRKRQECFHGLECRDSPTAGTDECFPCGSRTDSDSQKCTGLAMAYSRAGSHLRP